MLLTYNKVKLKPNELLKPFDYEKCPKSKINDNKSKKKLFLTPEPKLKKKKKKSKNNIKIEPKKINFENNNLKKTNY